MSDEEKKVRTKPSARHGDVRVMASHGSGKDHVYRTTILRGDGSFIHCDHEEVKGKSKGGQINKNFTDMRMKSGPWSERIQFNHEGTKLVKRPLSISEARLYIEDWHNVREEKGYAPYSDIEVIDLTRIFEPEEQSHYDELLPEYKK